jgi:hypothetical protein
MPESFLADGGLNLDDLGFILFVLLIPGLSMVRRPKIPFHHGLPAPRVQNASPKKSGRGDIEGTVAKWSGSSIVAGDALAGLPARRCRGGRA